MRLLAAVLLVALSASVSAESVLDKMRRCRGHFNQALEATKQATDAQTHLSLWGKFMACVEGEKPALVQSDPLDPNAMTPEQKARFNKLYEEAIKKGNLLEFLKNWSTNEGKVHQGQEKLCKGVDPEPMGSKKERCRTLVKEKAAEVKANNKTVNNNQVKLWARECSKAYDKEFRKRLNCVNETAEACQAAGAQGTSFDAKQYLRSCIERPDPTTTPRPTRPPRKTSFQICTEQFNKLPVDKKKGATNYVKNCVMRRKLYGLCRRRFLEAKKTQKDLKGSKFIAQCMQQEMQKLKTTVATRPTKLAQTRPPTTVKPTRPPTTQATRTSAPTRPPTTV